MTEEKDKTRLGVSMPQVVGAALAAVTAAFVGSVLGVYGTVLGAGLASIVTTVGATLYQRSIERTKDKVKDTVAKVPVKALRSQSVVAQSIEQESAEPEPESKIEQQPDLPAQRGQEGHRSAPLRRAELPRRQVHAPLPKPQVRADSQQTRVFRPITPGTGQTGGQPRDATQSGGTQSGSPRSVGGSPQTGQRWPGQDPDQTRMQDADRLRFMRPATPGEQPTRQIDQRTQQVDQRTQRIAPEAQQTNVLGATGSPEPGEPEQEQAGKRKNGKLKWSLIALTAGLAFGIAMLAVNGFELATGKSISGDSRTTFSGVLNPGSGQQQPEQPAEQPAPVEPTEPSVPPQNEAPQPTPEEGSPEDRVTGEQPPPEEQDQTTTEPQQPPEEQQPEPQPAPQPAPQPGLQQGSSG